MKQVLRMCIVCKQMKDRAEMIRFIKSDNQIVIDKSQKVALMFASVKIAFQN